VGTERIHRGPVCGALLALIAVAAVVVLLAADQAAADTFRVTRTDDPPPGKCNQQDCSLREAVLAANRHRGTDEVKLRSGVEYRLERSGDSDRGGDLDVRSGIVVRAAAGGAATIVGSGMERVMEFKGPGRSRLERMTIVGGEDEAVRIIDRSRTGRPTATLVMRRGKVRRSEGLGISGYNSRLGVRGARVKLNDSLVFGNASGIWAQSVSLKQTRVFRNTEFGGVFACDRLQVTRSVVAGNATEGDSAGGIQIGDDQNSDPDCVGYRFQITNSRIIGNTSTEGSGGVDTGDGGGRGSIVGSAIGNNHGRATGGLNLGFADTFVRDSTVLANTGVQEAGGVTGREVRIADSTVEGNAGEAGGMDVSDLRMARTTVSGNEATVDGGGVLVFRASIINSTIAGNAAARDGGGIAIEGARGTGLAWSTVAYNRANADDAGAGQGGGLAWLGSRPWPVRDSLIAFNSVEGSNPGAQCAGAFAATGHSLLTSDDPSCTGLGGPGDLIRSDPRVGALADNGGPTETVALRPGSPAVGAAARRNAPEIDQRRVRRDRHPNTSLFECH
jgi:CSLREA domain-containing protein